MQNINTQIRVLRLVETDDVEILSHPTTSTEPQVIKALLLKMIEKAIDVIDQEGATLEATNF